MAALQLLLLLTLFSGYCLATPTKLCQDIYIDGMDPETFPYANALQGVFRYGKGLYYTHDNKDIAIGITQHNIKIVNKEMKPIVKVTVQDETLKRLVNKETDITSLPRAVWKYLDPLTGKFVQFYHLRFSCVPEYMRSCAASRFQFHFNDQHYSTSNLLKGKSFVEERREGYPNYFNFRPVYHTLGNELWLYYYKTNNTLAVAAVDGFRGWVISTTNPLLHHDDNHILLRTTDHAFKLDYVTGIWQEKSDTGLVWQNVRDFHARCEPVKQTTTHMKLTYNYYEDDADNDYNYDYINDSGTSICHSGWLLQQQQQQGRVDEYCICDDGYSGKYCNMTLATCPDIAVLSKSIKAAAVYSDAKEQYFVGDSVVVRSKEGHRFQVICDATMKWQTEGMWPKFSKPKMQTAKSTVDVDDVLATAMGQDADRPVLATHSMSPVCLYIMMIVTALVVITILVLAVHLYHYYRRPNIKQQSSNESLLEDEMERGDVNETEL